MKHLLFFSLLIFVFAQTPSCSFSLPSTCNSTGCPVTIPKNSYISFLYTCTICNVSLQVSSRATDSLQVIAPNWLIPRLYAPMTHQEYITYVMFTDLTDLNTTCFERQNVQVNTVGTGFRYIIYCKNTNVD